MGRTRPEWILAAERDKRERSHRYAIELQERRASKPQEWTRWKIQSHINCSRGGETPTLAWSWGSHSIGFQNKTTFVFQLEMVKYQDDLESENAPNIDKKLADYRRKLMEKLEKDLDAFDDGQISEELSRKKESKKSKNDDRSERKRSREPKRRSRDRKRSRSRERRSRSRDRRSRSRERDRYPVTLWNFANSSHI